MNTELTEQLIASSSGLTKRKNNSNAALTEEINVSRRNNAHHGSSNGGPRDVYSIVQARDGYRTTTARFYDSRQQLLEQHEGSYAHFGMQTPVEMRTFVDTVGTKFLPCSMYTVLTIGTSVRPSLLHEIKPYMS